MESQSVVEKGILEDIARIYRFLEVSNQTINTFYENLESAEITSLFQEVFKELGESLEIRLACVERVVGLKESGILNVFQKLQINEEKALKLRLVLLRITRDFYLQKHQEILDFIAKDTLLTPFWRALLRLIHQLGEVFNIFFIQWQEKLILGINKDLNMRFNGNFTAILKALEPSMERSSEDFSLQGGFSVKGELSDRSYSVPLFCDSTFKAVAYAEFFKEPFCAFETLLTQGIETLEGITEIAPRLEQKDAHIAYLKALKFALGQKDCGKLLESWRLVDKAWMEISTPLQIGHPLEYYEDHFRKAVAPEWDLRIARIYQGVDLLATQSKEDFKFSKECVLDFYVKYSAKQPHTLFKDSIDYCVKEALERTQSYGGMPLLFYGAELNGLFSAQVVPNDEKVSAKYGKKIFYFPDRVYELSKVKPFMLLASKTFPKEFLDFNRALLYFRKEDWYKVYEISTIGHEFGHILWVDFESELRMNGSGQFKNIEEFKATMGGIALYVSQEHRPLLKELVCDTIARAVGLIAWMQEDAVLPYYCEALIHLEVLFSSGVLDYTGSFKETALRVNVNAESLKVLEENYLEIYDKLIATYLHKSDAKEFLETYVFKDFKGYYKPKNSQTRSFVEDYYAQYLAIGQVQDPLTIARWIEQYKQNIRDNHATNYQSR